MKKSKALPWAFPLILFLAFILRAIGVSFGLPHVYHADEPIVVNHALAYGTGDFHPHFFKIPPLVSYLLFGCYGIFYLIGRIAGTFQSTVDFENFFYGDPTTFYLIARGIFGVFMGSATICLFYRILKKYFSEGLALLTSLLLAVSFLHVRDSHFIYADIPLLFVLVMTFFPLLKLTSKGNALKTHLKVGFFIGLATAVKYNGAALVFPYIFCSFASRPRSKLVILWFAAAGVAAATFFVLNPYSLLDMPFFLREVETQSRSHGGVGFVHPLFYSLAEGVSWPLLIAAFLGMVNCLKDRDSKKIALLIFSLAYYMIISLWGQPYDRYALPLVPFAAFFAADSILKMVSQTRRNGVRGAGVLILGLAAGMNLTKSILFDVLLCRSDTRTVAKHWVEKNLPSGSHLALDWEFYMPRLRFTRHQLEEKKEQLSQPSKDFTGIQRRRLDFLLAEARESVPRYNLYFLSKDLHTHRFLFSQPAVPLSLSALIDRGVEYVLVGGFPEKAERAAFLSELRNSAQKIAVFSPYKDPARVQPYDTLPLTGGPFTWEEIWNRLRNGLAIEVYKLR